MLFMNKYDRYDLIFFLPLLTHAISIFRASANEGLVFSNVTITKRGDSL